MRLFSQSVVTILCACAAVFTLAGCSSIGKGMAKAVMAKAEEKPAPEKSLCEITGPEFAGLSAGFETASEKPKTLRLIIVHGIGEHQPGYSLRLQENVAARLGLNIVEPVPKTIAMQTPTDSKALPGADVGTLRISRYTNDKGNELLTFEVTWSALFDADRKAVAFDDYGLHSGARADINQSLKKLINSFTEPLAYHGPKGELARNSVIQALCWSARGTWNDYPADGKLSCNPRDTQKAVIERDTFAISTHSLGSRMAIDGLMALGNTRDAYARDPKSRAGFEAMELLRDKQITFFMLANQLPLLQVGQAPPAIVGKSAQYCGPGAARVRERLFRHLSIIAFSDPNDVLSYRIPETFVRDNLDSRLCAEATNVSIAVANTVSIPGVSFASPEVAHTAYEDNERVLSLMALGLAESSPPPGCSWLKSRPNQ